MRPPLVRLAAAVLVVGACTAVAAAQVTLEAFMATASVRKGTITASAPFSVTITRYGSTPEREAVMNAIRDGGTAALQGVLAKMDDAGFLQIGERRTPIKFAAQRPTASGRLITVVTAEPVLFLGEGLPASRPRHGFNVAVAMLYPGDSAFGELAPAAKVGLDSSGALLIEDYGETVVWLKGLAAAR